MIRWSCTGTGRDTGVQKSRKVNKYKEQGDEVDKLGGLFIDGLCTAAAIGQLLRQQMFKVGEGGKSPTSAIFAIRSSHRQQRTGRKGGQMRCWLQG